MIDIIEIKNEVKDGILEFYTNDKGTIFCKDTKNGETVAVGYASKLQKAISEILEKQNKELGIK